MESALYGVYTLVVTVCIRNLTRSLRSLVRFLIRHNSRALSMKYSLFIIWLAPWAGKMNKIARCDWLPERARWSHLARSGLPAVSRKQNFTKSHIINPLLTKFVRSRWLDIGLVLFFCGFMDLDFVSVHKHTKKELGQYPAILTSHLDNNPYIFVVILRVGVGNARRY